MTPRQCDSLNRPAVGQGPRATFPYHDICTLTGALPGRVFRSHLLCCLLCCALGVLPLLPIASRKGGIRRLRVRLLLLRPRGMLPKCAASKVAMLLDCGCRHKALGRRQLVQLTVPLRQLVPHWLSCALLLHSDGDRAVWMGGHPGALLRLMPAKHGLLLRLSLRTLCAVRLAL